MLLCAAGTPETSNSNNSQCVEDSIIGIGDLEFFSKQGNYIVYFGRPTCIDCVKFEPTLLEHLESTGHEVYYFNTDYWKTNPEFEGILSNYQVDSVPMLVKIQNGDFVDKYIPDVSLTAEELGEKLNTFFQEKEQGKEQMIFEMINAAGRPVQFTNYFEAFTFLLMTFNCVCMINAFKNRNIKESCALRLIINSTIVFVFHIIICCFGAQYAMWAEAEPSTHIVAQLGMLTWLFVTPLLYIATVVFFVLVVRSKRKRTESLDNRI